MQIIAAEKQHVSAIANESIFSIPIRPTGEKEDETIISNNFGNFVVMQLSGGSRCH